MKEIIVIRNTENVTTTNKKSPADDIGERCHLKYPSFLKFIGSVLNFPLTFACVVCRR